MNQITCKNLNIGYDGKTIVEGINLEVEKGDYLCIVGGNGKGKSTLLKTMLRLIPIIDGEIEYDPTIKMTEMGYLPQQTTFKKDFPASVYEVVISGCASLSRRPFYGKIEKEIVKNNLELLGISHIEKDSFAKLSGGQKQRVLLARALSSNAKILFLDEPITGLDITTADSLYKTIQKLNDNGITIIMITHDIMTSLKYAKHVYYIGDELFFGSQKDFENSEIVKELIRKRDATNG